MKLVKSDRKDKKYKAIFADGTTIHFGAAGMSDYTIHHDDERKERYLKRFDKLIQKFKNDPKAPITLATQILWNKKTISASLADFKKRFKTALFG